MFEIDKVKFGNFLNEFKEALYYVLSDSEKV